MIPLKLKLTNFFSYRESEIDFTKLAPVMLIVGQIEGHKGKSNGCGKSSIFDAICFVLFGQCRVTGSKNVTLDDLICWGEDEASVEFNFMVDNAEYSIVRTRSRKRRSTRVEFKTWTGTKWRSVGDRKKDTQNRILETIGLDYVIFSNSVFFKQGEVSAFAEMTSGERKDVIKKLLNIVKYQSCCERAKKRYDKLVEETSVDQSYLDINTNIDERLVEVQNLIKNLNTRIDLDSQNKLICNKKITKLQTQLIKNKEQVTLKHQLEDERSILTSSLMSLNEALQIQEKEKLEYKDEIEKAQLLFDSFTEEFNQLVTKTPDKQNLKERMGHTKQEYASSEIELNKVNTIKISFETEMNKIKNSIKNVRELGLGECPTCFADVSDKSKADIEKHLKEEFGKFKPKFKDANSSFDQWTVRVTEINKEIENIRTEANGYNRILQDKKLVKEKIDNQVTVGVQTQVNLDKTEVTISKNKEQLQQDSKSLETKNKQYLKLQDVDIESHQSIQTEIGIEQIHIEQLDTSMDNTNIQKGSYLEQERDLIIKKNEVDRLNKKLKHIQKKKQIFLELSKAFGKNGIQALILENSAVEIEKIANELLKDFTDNSMSIVINTLRKNRTEDTYQEVFDIEIRDGSRIGLFETFSGGEKFKVAFAIRIALSLLLMRKSGIPLPFILYDEAFSDLDDDSTAKLVDIFFILKKYFELQLIITHDTKLKDKFNNILTVHKDSKGSRIIY